MVCLKILLYPFTNYFWKHRKQIYGLIFRVKSGAFMWPLKVSIDGSQVWAHVRITQGTLDQILWEGGLGRWGDCRGVEGLACVCYIILLGVAKFENYCPARSFQSYIACELIRNVNYQALPWIWGFPAGSSGKESSCQCRSLRRHRVNFLSRYNPLEKEMATYSSILAWEIPWTEGPGGLQSRGLPKSWTWLGN